VGVLVKDGTVSTDVACLVTLLLADGSHTAGTETSRSGTDELGSTADQLKLLMGGAELKLGPE
jgi:hypothetical protein